MTSPAARSRPETWLAAVWSLLLRIALLCVTLYVLWRLQIVIIVVLMAAMLAFTVAPVADWLCRSPLLRPLPRPYRRTVSVTVVFLVLAVALVQLVLMIVDPLRAEIQQFSDSAYRRQIEGWIANAQKYFQQLPPDVQAALRSLEFGRILGEAGRQIQHLMMRTLEGGKFIVELILIPVLAFSFLTESRPLKREFAVAIPRRRLRDGLYVLRQSGMILQSYAIGQLILALIAGVVVYALMIGLGMKYALAMAVVAAVTRVIPVIGPLLGGIPIVALSAFQGTDKAAVILVAFTLMHLIESKVVMPRLIGYRIQLHPAVVIIVLLIGAEFFGVWGMFLAAPVAAVVKALFHYFVVRPRTGRRLFPPSPRTQKARAQDAKEAKEADVGLPSIAGVGDHSRAHEFLPISSTAHLILAPQLLAVAPPRSEIAHTYDTFIQIGTVLPVLAYFWRDWLNLLRALLRILKQRKVTTDPDERMVKYLVLGSIPAGVAGLLLEDKIELLADPGRFPEAFLFIGGALIVVGVIMWWAEGIGRKSRDIEHLGMPDAWLVGFAQALALWPGVSRSGATITAGLLAGLTREAAARFSFLLMTPIMFAATGYKLVKLLRGTEQLTSDEWGGMLLATAVAAVTGYLAIAWLLRWLRTRTLAFFAVYRIALGAFVIGLYFAQR